MEGYISKIETFGSVDGPGIRFLVFLSGCPFRCLYCHNPETWKLEDGTKADSEELIQKALRYKAYWGKEGGITVSGGEPLVQIDFLIDLFKKAKKEGINTCLDTSGATFKSEPKYLQKFDELLQYTDLFLLDIKHIDEARHKELTGKGNKHVLEMARYLDDKGKKMWIRHVLVPSITDDDRYLEELRKFLDSLVNIERVEVLPYHDLARIKYQELGIPYPLEDTPIPTKERVDNARKILRAR